MENWLDMYGEGSLIKRADGSYSQRGLWDNIRANRGSGRKPTKEMLRQERKIKKKADGGWVDMYEDGDVVTEGNPPSRLQELAAQYQAIQEQVNKGDLNKKAYLDKMRSVADDLIAKGFTLEDSGIIPKSVYEHSTSTGSCIGTACYIADQAGDKFYPQGSSFFTSNSNAQDYARDNPNASRYLEQDEKYISPTDIIQFKSGEKGVPFHAYTVYDIGQPNEEGDRIITVVGSPGHGPVHKKTYILGKDNKIYSDQYGSKGSMLDTQLLKRREDNTEYNNLLSQRDALKQQILEVDPTYFTPKEDIRSGDYRQTAFMLNDQGQGNQYGDYVQTKDGLNIQTPNPGIIDRGYTQGNPFTTPRPYIDASKSGLTEILAKYNDPQYKYDYMRTHNISNAEYDALVSNMVGIYGAETKFGTDYFGKDKKIMGVKVPAPEWPWATKLADKLGIINQEDISIGPFQLKYNDLPEAYRKTIKGHELYNPMTAADAAMEYLTAGLPLLRKRANTTAETATEDNPYSQNITKDNYLEYVPYLYSLRGWLKGDESTMEKKGDILKGEAGYKQLVDQYRNNVLQIIPLSLFDPTTGNTPTITQQRNGGYVQKPCCNDKYNDGSIVRNNDEYEQAKARYIKASSKGIMGQNEVQQLVKQYPQLANDNSVAVAKVFLSKPSVSLEQKINKKLNNPMGKAAFKAEEVANIGEDPIDNYRHPLAGMYTAQGISNLFPNLLQYTGVPQGVGFLGSTALGIAHELQDNAITHPNKYPQDYTLWDTIREGEEDAFNNMVGAAVGVTPFTSDKEKEDFLFNLSQKNYLPDGYGKGNMYFKKDGGWINMYNAGSWVADSSIPTPTSPSFYDAGADRTLTNYQMGTPKARMYADGGPTGGGGGVQPFRTSNIDLYNYRQQAYADSAYAHNYGLENLKKEMKRVQTNINNFNKNVPSNISKLGTDITPTPYDGPLETIRNIKATSVVFPDHRVTKDTYDWAEANNKSFANYWNADDHWQGNDDFNFAASLYDAPKQAVELELNPIDKKIQPIPEVDEELKRDPIRRVLNPRFNINTKGTSTVDELGNPRYVYYNQDKLISEGEFNKLMMKHANGGPIMYNAGSTVFTKQNSALWVNGGKEIGTQDKRYPSRNTRSLNPNRYIIGDDVIPTGMDYKTPSAGTYDYNKDRQPPKKMVYHAPDTLRIGGIQSAKHGGHITNEYKERVGIPYAISPGVSDAGMYVGPTTQRGGMMFGGGSTVGNGETLPVDPRTGMPVKTLKGIEVIANRPLTLEQKIDKRLGYPMKKAFDAAAAFEIDRYNKKLEGIPTDNYRHPMGAKYTSEAIQREFPSFLKGTGIPEVAGFVGANALGLGHEIKAFNSDRPLWESIRSTGEDLYNNAFGAAVGSLSFLPEAQKTKILQGATINGYIPDGEHYGEFDINNYRNTNSLQQKKRRDGGWIDKYDAGSTVGENPNRIIPSFSEDMMDINYQEAKNNSIYNKPFNARYKTPDYSQEPIYNIPGITIAKSKATGEEWGYPTADYEKRLIELEEDPSKWNIKDWTTYGIKEGDSTLEGIYDPLNWPAFLETGIAAAPFVLSALQLPAVVGGTTIPWLTGNNLLAAGMASNIPGNIQRGEYVDAALNAMPFWFNPQTIRTGANLFNGVKNFGNTIAASKESGVLSNAWKYNPWRFKNNPNAYYHRSPNLGNIINQETKTLQGFGQSEEGSIFSEGKDYFPGTKLNLRKPANSQLYFSKGVPLDYGRYNPETFDVTGKRIMTGQGYPGPYLVEVENVPMGASTKGRAPGAEPKGLESYAVSKRPVSLDEAKLYKEDWLWGYKKIPTKTNKNFLDQTGEFLTTQTPFKNTYKLFPEGTFTGYSKLGNTAGFDETIDLFPTDVKVFEGTPHWFKGFKETTPSRIRTVSKVGTDKFFDATGIKFNPGSVEYTENSMTLKNPSRDAVYNTIKDNAEYIKSDLYKSRRMAATGETSAQVDKATDQYLREFENGRINLDFTKQPTTETGFTKTGSYSSNAFMTSKFPFIRRGSNITLYPRDIENADNLLGSFGHEVGHAFSPVQKRFFGYGSDKGFTKFPALQLRDYKSPGLTKDEAYDIRTYFNTPEEQGVRGYKLNRDIRNSLGLTFDNTPVLGKRHIQTWFENPNNQAKLRTGPLSDVGDLLKEGALYQMQQFGGNYSRPMFRLNIQDWLNKTHEDGGYVQNNNSNTWLEQYN